MIGIDTTICIEEIVDRTENLFLARLLGRAPPSNPFIALENEYSTPATQYMPHGCVSLSGYLLGPFRSVLQDSCNRAQFSAWESFAICGLPDLVPQSVK